MSASIWNPCVDSDTPIGEISASQVEFIQAGTGAVIRTAESKLREIVSVKDFGAVGDGIVDDTAAIQAAMNATSAGSSLVFEPGKRYITSNTLTGVNLSIDGNGATLVSTGDFIPLQISNLKSTRSVTIAVTQYQYDVDLGADYDVAVGDILRLRSNTARLSGVDYRHGWVATVTAVAGTTVTLSRAAYDAFTVHNIDIYEASNGVSIVNLNAEHSLPSGGAGSPTINIIGDNVLVQGCVLTGNQYAAIGLNILGSNLRVVGCTMIGYLNVDGDGDGGRTGYGSQLFGNDLLWENCVFVNCKHGQATGSRSSTDINATVRGCYFFSSDVNTLACIDTHAGLLTDFVVQDCYAECYERAINVRNGRAIIENCTFVKYNNSTNDSNVFISVFEQTLKGVTIRNNRFEALGGNVLFMQGINVEEPLESANLTFEGNQITGARLMAVITDLALSNVKVRNNVISCPTQGLIRHKDMDMSNVLIEGNELEVQSLLADASSSAFELSNITFKNNNITLTTGTGALKYANDYPTIDALNIVDNVIDATGITSGEYVFNFGQLPTVSNMKMTGNTIIRGDTEGIRLFGNATYMPSIEKFRFEGNTIDSQLYVSDCDLTSVSIARNTFTNDTSGTPSIVFAKNINTPTYESVSVVGNTFDSANTTTTPVISIQNDIVYTNPLRIAGNVFNTAADAAYAVVANSGATSNLIEFSGNTARRGFDDDSETYAIPPVGNYIWGVNKQMWKGSVTVDQSGKFILSTAPAAGDWVRGEVVWDSSPTASDFIGWVCTSSGTPGTWKTFGAISA